MSHEGTEARRTLRETNRKLHVSAPPWLTLCELRNTLRSPHRSFEEASAPHPDIVRHMITKISHVTLFVTNQEEAKSST